MQAKGSQFFHVTSQDALPSIRQHGIDNTKSTKEVWSNPDDWDDGAYMWDSPQKALSYAKTMKSDDFRPVVLGVSGVETSPDTTGSSPVEGAHYAKSVPTEAIRYPKRFA